MKNIDEVTEYIQNTDRKKQENTERLMNFLKKNRGRAFTENEIEKEIGNFEPYSWSETFPKFIFLPYLIESKYFEEETYYWIAPNWFGAIFLLLLLILYFGIIIVEII